MILKRVIRIFLSSPGDVEQERNSARAIIAKLGEDAWIRENALLKIIAWDNPSAGVPMLATLNPQDAIKKGLPEPKECDIVLVIVWSRMGTILDSDVHGTKPNGQAYLGGTDWEYWNALQGSQQTGKPKILVYRRTDTPTIALDDPDFDDKFEQYNLVKDFFAQLQNNFTPYDKPSDFETLLEKQLRNLVMDLLVENQIEKNKVASAPVNNAPNLIFISHATEDDEFVNKLSTRLDDVGYKTFVDHRDIASGHWTQQVQHALDNCREMILVVSDNSMTSTNVEDEWHYYMEESKKIHLVRIEDAKIHFRLRRLQFIDFVDADFENGIQKLMSYLGWGD